MSIKSNFIALGVTALALSSCAGGGGATQSTASQEHQDFPYIMPEEKPDFPLSAAYERVYDEYGVATPQQNELYTQFRYTALEGLDYSNEDCTVTRRDPSRIVKVGDTFYVWYTLRRTAQPPSRNAATDDESIPLVDWDLSDIGYATSKDGFTWTDQGVAAHRPAKPQVGWRSISTPEILVWEDKYYLYFQAFDDPKRENGDSCPVSIAVADSPDGPWEVKDQIVIPNGVEGAWDQNSIHDPLPVVFKGKIYLYYKSDFNRPNTVRSQSLAIADNPFGPFTKCEVNPVISSGHETEYFRFKEGIAAILFGDGHEHNTIQYSEDGINFKIASITSLVPEAGGLYDPDAFTNTEYARGITWGLSHILNFMPGKMYTRLIRFDCDLSLDLHDPELKQNYVRNTYEEHLRHRLSPKQRERIMNDLKK